MNCAELASKYLDNFTKVDAAAKLCAVWPSQASFKNTPHLHTPFALQVPWDDLQYLFGEIIYGGHIVEQWDR